jgi:hypothetical protein
MSNDIQTSVRITRRCTLYSKRNRQVLIQNHFQTILYIITTIISLSQSFDDQLARYQSSIIPSVRLLKDTFIEYNNNTLFRHNL